MRRWMPRVAVTHVVGSPSTRSRSAARPAAMRPRSGQSEALGGCDAGCGERLGVSPVSTSSSSSRCSMTPCPATEIASARCTAEPSSTCSASGSSTPHDGNRASLITQSGPEPEPVFRDRRHSSRGVKLGLWSWNPTTGRHHRQPRVPTRFPSRGRRHRMACHTHRPESPTSGRWAPFARRGTGCGSPAAASRRRPASTRP
jgi:hypothetical protein